MTTGTITFRADAKLIKQIGVLADSMDRSRNWVIETGMRRYVEEEAATLAAIKEGIAQLERGEVIPFDEAMAELDDVLAEYGVPPYRGKK